MVVEARTQLRSPSSRSPLLPPLKWAGGKRWLVPALRELYLPFKNHRLVEPFLGGMAIALGLEPADALLADVNPHAVNFYRWLKRGLKISLPMQNSRTCFERQRQKFNSFIRSKKSSTAEAAALFYYLNRTGYNGLCRFNSAGLFNVPFGKYVRINYTRDFADYKAVLAPWKFKCCDFEKLEVMKSDFVYADPPYDVEFTRYAQRNFSWSDQERLAEWLAAHPGPVVASNQATPRIVALYTGLGFDVHTIRVRRMIACNGDRTPAREILAVRNVPAPCQKRALRAL
jgi:DNA adenine methylase